MSRCAALWVLCGCGRFGFDARSATDATTNPEADAVVLTCTNLMPADDFAPGVACGSWASPTTRGMDMARNNGVLEITPAVAMTGNDFGGCTLNNYDLARGGTFIEVPSVLGGQDAYTNIVAYTPNGVGIQVDGATNMIKVIGVVGNAAQPYDPVAMRFWQLLSSGSILHLNVSADALRWTELKAVDRGSDNLASVTLAFGAGRFGPIATGIAIFDNFNSCP